MCDETWVFFQPTRPKSDNKASVAPCEKKPRVVRDSAMTTKKLLSVIFTANRKFHVQATKKGEQIDSEYFIDFLRTCGNKWRALRSDPTHLKDLLLQFGNAQPHVSATTKTFLADRHVKTLWKSPYSPDLNLCDRWLFMWLKKSFKERTFNDADEVAEAALQVLRSTPESTYQHQIQKLVDYCQMVIDNGGDYVTE